MIVNGKSLLDARPLEDMVEVKVRFAGTSHGLAEAGYDLRIAQTIEFFPPDTIRLYELFTEDYDPNHSVYATAMKKAHLGWIKVTFEDGTIEETIGRFTLASAIEKFTMPANLVGVVHDKSTWARKGLSVFNTVAEPQWNGYLTLELVFHGNEPVTITGGQGISQVLFDTLSEDGNYGDGKYQNQENEPVKARS